MTGEDKQAYIPAVQALEKDAKMLKEELLAAPWDSVDVNGGSRVYMDAVCEAVEYFCSLMLDSIQNNDRKPRNVRAFKKFV